MTYKAYNNGMTQEFVRPDYQVQEGEALFPDIPTVEELVAHFPGYAAASAPVEADYVAAAQALLDTTARTRGYDGILSLASYAASTNPTFRTEALAGMSWRDEVWTAGYALLAEVQAGKTPAPTVAAFMASLPAMVWP
jgi:hypothetical protein